MLKLRDLAGRADFQLGLLSISPARRQVAGPAGTVSLEPLVMQVLLLLIDAQGRVVTRDELFEQCWGGVPVGDDSINRVTARVRRVLAQTAPGALQLETIPRTGYRLTRADVGEPPGPAAEIEAGFEPSRSTRRSVLLAGGASVAAAAFAGSWWVKRDRQDRRFADLMRRGEEALRNGTEDLGTTQLFEEAARIDPNSARAWGRLAYLRTVVTNISPASQSTLLIGPAQSAANRALELDPQEPYALTALALLKEWMDGWAAFDRRLRAIMQIDPANPAPMTALMMLLQAAGLTGESWPLNERLVQLQPLSPAPIFRRALKLWIIGRVADAYKVIERASELWPASPQVWNARLLIFAFSGRAPAARAMLDANPGMLGAPEAMSVWRASLAALTDRSPTAIAVATSANLKAAQQAPGLAAHAAMVLAALGQEDAAFEVMNGVLLSRGPILVRVPTASSKGMITARGWRWTQWLFTPPTATMRSDPRFKKLCQDVGLVDYWTRRNVVPDFMREAFRG